MVEFKAEDSCGSRKGRSRDMDAEVEVKVKSLQKALEILNCFIEKQPLGVTEISEKLGLYKSNAHNILMTFVAMEYLVQDEDTGKFRLGSRVLELSHALGDSCDILKLSRPYMDRISEQFNEITYLAIPHKNEVIYLGASYPDHYHMSAQNLWGESAPMHCTGVGKAMLSRLSGEFLEQYMARPMIRLTEHTITDPALLRREIDRVRRDGYALDDMELQIGITCVGVPLVDRKNRLQGALSVSGPSPRFDREKIQEIQVQLRAVAEDLSRLL